jgi:polar amino acid transport system substrate-binding protein
MSPSAILKIFLLAPILFWNINGVAASDKGVIEIVSLSYYPPYSGKGLYKKGFSTHIVDKAFRRAGYETKTIMLPFARAYRAVKKGWYDVIHSIWFRKNRTEFFAYTDSYQRTKLVFAHQSDVEFTFYGMEDVYGKTVALVKGYNYPDYISNSSNFTKYRTQNLKNSLAMLAAGRVDLAVGDRKAMKHIADKHKEEIGNKIKVDSRSVRIDPLYVAVSKTIDDHEKIAKEFNKSLKSMQNDGTYDRIMTEHGFPTHVKLR